MVKLIDTFHNLRYQIQWRLVVTDYRYDRWPRAGAKGLRGVAIKPCTRYVLFTHLPERAVMLHGRGTQRQRRGVLLQFQALRRTETVYRFTVLPADGYITSRSVTTWCGRNSGVAYH